LPDIPPGIIAAVARVLGDHWGGAPDDSDMQLAADVLNVAAPLLAEVCAQKILAHMDEHWPSPPMGSTRNVPRHYMRIAAQVAALAFSTDADSSHQCADGQGSAFQASAVPR
jgi:hypothetical protein